MTTDKTTTIIPPNSFMLNSAIEWINANEGVPHLVVVQEGCPDFLHQYTRDNVVVLNIAAHATANLTVSQDYVMFNARFGGVAREVVIPMWACVAVYDRENQDINMGFPSMATSDIVPTEEPPRSEKRPSLSVVK